MNEYGFCCFLRFYIGNECCENENFKKAIIQENQLNYECNWGTIMKNSYAYLGYNGKHENIGR